MFQVKAQNGYEIQVIGDGPNGLCRVEDQYYQTRFSGTYQQCVAWLASRGVQLL